MTHLLGTEHCRMWNATRPQISRLEQSKDHGKFETDATGGRAAPCGREVAAILTR